LNVTVADYLSDPLSSGKAVICAMFSWHLVDWVHQEYPVVTVKFPKLTDYKLHLKSECKSLSYMQDITNGTKHRSITNYLPSIKKAKEHGGAFQLNAFSNAFDVPCLQLTLTNGIILHFNEEVIKVRDYWNTYFTETLKECV
jgi:hypothetical protein